MRKSPLKVELGFSFVSYTRLNWKDVFKFYRQHRFQLIVTFLQQRPVLKLIGLSAKRDPKTPAFTAWPTDGPAFPL
jgi:hypothetical protein